LAVIIIIETQKYWRDIRWMYRFFSYLITIII